MCRKIPGLSNALKSGSSSMVVPKVGIITAGVGVFGSM